MLHLSSLPVADILYMNLVSQSLCSNERVLEASLPYGNSHANQIGRGTLLNTVWNVLTNNHN